MAKILSFGSGQFVKYPFLNRLRDWWSDQEKFFKLTLVTILLLIISTPVIVSTYLTIRQEAGNGNRKVFLGLVDAYGVGGLTGGHEYDLTYVRAVLENIKKQTGVYPATYSVFITLENPAPSLEFLQFLDSKGVTPVVNIGPVGDPMLRRDGRYKLSLDTTDPGESLEKELVKFNSSKPAEITKMWVSKTYFDTPAKKVVGSPVKLFETWVPGASFSLVGSKENETADYENKNKFDFKVVNKTEKVNYWEIELRVEKTGELTGVFGDNKPVFLTMADTFGKDWGNQRISEGSLDSKFKEFGGVAKQFGRPIIFRYAFEMNEDWFPWSDGKRKEEIGPYKTLQYFDVGNTPANYISAWKHVYDVIKGDPKGINARNVYFFWCPITSNSSEDILRSFFPGNDYVDYVGYDIYSGTKQQAHESVESIVGGVNGPMRRLMKVTDNKKSNKKILIGEMGINASNNNIPYDEFPTYRKRWLLEGYTYLYETFPDLRGIMYFNLDVRDLESSVNKKGETAENNWLISNSFSHKPNPDPIPDILSSYKTLLADPRFQGKFNPPGRDDPPDESITPTPADISDPIGNHDSSSCSVITGWACDKNNYSEALTVEFYADNPKDAGGIFLGNTIANIPRESVVAQMCGGRRAHGFSFTTPASLANGRPHKIYAYANNIGLGSTVLINDSPKATYCGVGSQSEFSTTLFPLDDTYTDAAKPKQNYGRSIYLKADGNPLNIIYLKFNTKPYLGKTIKSAILELTVSSGQNAKEAKSALAKGLNVREIYGSWEDAKITHDNHPLYGTIVESHKGAVVNGDVVRLDLTDFVKTHLSVNSSFILVNRDSDGVIFNSSQASKGKPQLTITYQN